MSLPAELVVALTLASLDTAEEIVRKEVQNRQALKRDMVGTLYPSIVEGEIDTLYQIIEQKRRERP